LKTPIRPGIPCENQETPDLRSGGPGAAPPQARSSAGSSILDGPGADTPLGRATREYVQIYNDYLQAQSTQEAANGRRGNGMMADVLQRFRAYDRRYGEWWDKVGGGG
jgi:hypothetical protein